MIKKLVPETFSIKEINIILMYTTSCIKEEEKSKQPKTTPLNQTIRSKPSVNLQILIL